MKKLFMQLWQLKPDFLPKFVYALILLSIVVFGLGVAAVGSWVLLTQIDYM
ncbi:MAG: hypothetical protein WCI39_06045 [Gallionellaceae bacterium]